MQGGYNMNIRCNQKFMFCNDSGYIYTRDMRAQHFWGFPFYHPVPTMRIPTLPPAGRKKVAFQCFNGHRKLNFHCRRGYKKLQSYT